MKTHKAISNCSKGHEKRSSIQKTYKHVPVVQQFLLGVRPTRIGSLMKFKRIVISKQWSSKGSLTILCKCKIRGCLKQVGIVLKKWSELYKVFQTFQEQNQASYFGK